jgi:hypothetical protein
VKRSRVWSWRTHPSPLAAGSGSRLLGLSLSGGEVHHQDPLHLVCGLVPRWRLQLNCSSVSVGSELASLWRCLLLGDGLRSTSLCLLPFVTSVTSLEREADFRPHHRHPWGNHCHGFNGRSALHLLHGYDELLSRVLYLGPP